MPPTPRWSRATLARQHRVRRGAPGKARHHDCPRTATSQCSRHDHNRYAHITTLRCDAVNPRLLGMKKVVSEDAVRRGLAKLDEEAGLAWLEKALDFCSLPL